MPTVLVPLLLALDQTLKLWALEHLSPVPKPLLGDLLFVLISLANREGVDLEAAFRQVMAKYQARDRSRWTPKDGG